jgi:uncharacterized protein (DUF433 family)
VPLAGATIGSISALPVEATICTMNIQKILRDRQIIHSDPEIMSGTPVFLGTRVPLQTFFDYLEGEAGLIEFIDDFPHLQPQALQVLEALQYVAG